MAKKKDNTRSIRGKIVRLNKSIESNRNPISVKRAVEKQIRQLKKEIGVKELYSSEVQRLKKESKYLSQKKSRLQSKDNLNKAEQKELFQIAKRQIEVSKRLHPERHDRRRKDYNPKKLPFKRDTETWKVITSNLPIYQVKSDFLHVAEKNLKVKSINIDGKEFSKTNWQRMYMYWQGYYGLVLQYSTDLRSGNLKDSDISFTTYRNSKGNKMKIKLNNDELSNNVNHALND